MAKATIATKGGWKIAAAAALLSCGAAAQAQPQPQPRPTIQQSFEAGSAALAEERWEDALRIFEGLETRVPGRRPRDLAIVRVRKAVALIELGRVDEAAAALRGSLSALPTSDRSLDEDRFRGHVALGRIAEGAFDYRAAGAEYRTAQAIEVEPRQKIGVYRGLIQTLMFFDAPAALAAADDALRVAGAMAPADPQLVAQFRTLRGRVLLNMGRFAEGRSEIEAAMRQLGGLTYRVDLRDLVARSDLAIAAFLAGDEEAARRYLAYTGAGRMRAAFLPRQSRGAPPRCGAGLSPADVAIVEFSIRDDGTVGYASPVYSSRSGEAAIHFARAVRAWWWAPDDIRRIAPLFRTAVRLELRCTQRSREQHELSESDLADLARWSAAHGAAFEAEPGRMILAPALREALAELEGRYGRAAPQLLLPLVRLGTSPELRGQEQLDLLTRALNIAVAANTPFAYRRSILRWLVWAINKAAGRDAAARPEFDSLLTLPPVRDDPGLVAALHLDDVRWNHRRGRPAAALEALDRARAAGLPAHHPLAAEILDAAATLEAARDDEAAAMAAWRAIPAGAPRCLFAPRRVSAQVGSEDFPASAVEWGFEGWTEVETLVGRSGPVSQRTVAAYPPFVFNGASEQIAGRFRFGNTFEPPEGPCAVFRQGFQFQFPR